MRRSTTLDDGHSIAQKTPKEKSPWRGEKKEEEKTAFNLNQLTPDTLVSHHLTRGYFSTDREYISPAGERGKRKKR